MMNVKKMLENYISNKARIAILEIDIEGYQKLIEYAGKSSGESLDEVIAGMSISASQVTDMPRSVTNKTGDSTGDIAINYHKELKFVNEQDKLEAIIRIKRIQDELEPLQTEVKKVEALIQWLPIKEKFVIQKRYIDGLYINEVAKLFAERFGYGTRRGIEKMIEECITEMGKKCA